MIIGSQGRRAERWPITVKNTAVIVVDMQNIWVHPRGLRYLPMSEDIVPKIQELLRFCRSNRVPVVYLHTTKRKDLADVGIFADIKPQTHNAEDEWSNFEGSPGAEFYEPVKPAEDDLVVKKFRYSGFYGTQLENLLRALGRDTIATVPPDTLRRFEDHGLISNALGSGSAGEAQAVMDTLTAGGIDFTDVNRTLEEEGIEKFATSFDKLLAAIAQKRRQMSRRAEEPGSAPVSSEGVH